MAQHSYAPVLQSPPPGQMTEVVPGIRWLRMPMPFSLDHINLYLLEDDDGWYLVDTGLNDTATHGHWQRILSAELGDKPLKGLLVTHYHPDHLGCAGWLAERGDLPVWISEPEHRAGAELLDNHRKLSPTDAQLRFFQRAGVEPDEAAVLLGAGRSLATFYSPLPNDCRFLSQGDQLRIGGFSWQVHVAQGHSPGHICLYCPERRILISGDQVLPQISSNVSVRVSEPEGDPLAVWLSSLTGMKTLAEDALVLPSHNHPFRGLHHRLDALIDSHHRQLDRIRALCDEPLTTRTLSQRLYPQADQGIDLLLAVGETLAHLQYLVNQGEFERTLNKLGQHLFRRAPDQIVEQRA